MRSWRGAEKEGWDLRADQLASFDLFSLVRCIKKARGKADKIIRQKLKAEEAAKTTFEFDDDAIERIRAQMIKTLKSIGEGGPFELAHVLERSADVFIDIKKGLKELFIVLPRR